MVSQSASSPSAARPKRIIVAMSGGVDSSVVAGLLKRQGHEVIGVTLQLYDHGRAVSRKGACCAGEDIHDARRVADKLGIPHYVFDYESRFRSAVIEQFADSYLSGETPIPCVTCNQQIKFADLLATAEELGADAMATGHYIALRQGTQGPELFRAQDAARDQSYFLFATTRAQLGKLMFPLGELAKSEVRSLAREFGLVVAEKSDSQDICFVPQGRYTDVIEKLRPEAAEGGVIRHVDGRILGEHGGIINYTIGQRRGLGIASSEPLYVVRLDAARREVVVGPRACLATQTIELRQVNWLGDEALPEEGIALAVRVRSSGALLPARVYPGAGETAQVVLEGEEFGVSAGQACVFYDGQHERARVLGGGFIVKSAENRATRGQAGAQLAAV